MSTDHLSPDTGRPRGRGFITAGVFLGIVVVLGLIAVVGARSGPGARDPGAAQSPPPTAASAVAGSSASGCAVLAGSTTGPTAAPSDLTWGLFDTVAVPASPTTGPGFVDGDVASCYAHTPAGALIAAAQLSVRYLLADDWQAVLAANVLPNAGASRYAAAHAQVTLQADGSASNGFGQIAAYAFQAYSPSTAVVELVWRFEDGTMQMTPVTLEWSAGDWKLVLEPTGAVGASTQTVANLLGYTVWGGV